MLDEWSWMLDNECGMNDAEYWMNYVGWIMLDEWF